MTRFVRSILPALLLLACRSTATPTASSAAPGGAPSAAGETLGILAPLDGTPVSIWPEAYSGGYLVLEVLAQGSLVKAGDVLARFDSRAIDEELHRQELELQSSQLGHRSTLERNRLEAEAAAANLARARAGLERARRSLVSWKTDELAFDQRQDELNKRYQQANVDDQTDELDQLEKMYKGDELVDATEDIVLKRSRRGLALTQDQNALSRDRAKVHHDLELALEGEKREEDFRAQQEALARLERQQALEASSRADAELRSADALALAQEAHARLQRDRAFFELKAPCAGLLLHGGVRDYRPGRSPARHERGSQLSPRTELFVVAPPAPAGVAFDVPDGQRVRFASGQSLSVRALAGDAKASAKVELDEYPRSLATSETTLEGRAKLEQALSGARYGERVRLELVEGKSASP
jgi:hypothetical protein